MTPDTSLQLDSTSGGSALWDTRILSERNNSNNQLLPMILVSRNDFL